MSITWMKKSQMSNVSQIIFIFRIVNIKNTVFVVLFCLYQVEILVYSAFSTNIMTRVSHSCQHKRVLCFWRTSRAWSVTELDVRNREEWRRRLPRRIMTRQSGWSVHRSSLYIAQDMKKGDILTKQNLRIVRPGLGLAPKYYDILIGKKVNKDVKKGTALNWELLNWDN